jgi:FkbM family methyltransferase
MKLISNWWVNDYETTILKRINSYNEKWPGKFDKISKLADQKNVFVDIGAHYGFVSRQMSKIFKEVHSFELIPDTYECLKANCKNFKNIKTYSYGLGNKNELVSAKLLKHNAGVSQVINDPNYIKLNNDFKFYKNLPIKTLDSFKFEEIDLLKIDVEGFEEYVLEGSIETLTRCEPIIILEITPKNHTDVINKNKSVEILNNLGYNLIYRPNMKDDFVFIK